MRSSFGADEGELRRNYARLHPMPGRQPGRQPKPALSELLGLRRPEPKKPKPELPGNEQGMPIAF